MSWLTKITGIDKAVNKMVDEKLNGINIPNINTPRLMQYRLQENKMWASGNANNLLMFYKTNQEPVTLQNRLAFWQWVGGIDVPKLHYPAPEALLNHLKSLLFSGDLVFRLSKGNGKETEQSNIALNERFDDLLKDINIDDILQNASYYESYSGSVAFKFVIDKEVHDKPIVQVYPRERFELVTKYGKTQQIIFKDEYKQGKDTYILQSYYGKGFIDYRLIDKNGKEVPVATVNELAHLKRIEFKTKILMACWKKNKSISKEFSDQVYGGSDFEGNIDLFHQIDEIYSTMGLYIRRSRPMTWVDESLLPVTKDGSATRTPKEWEFDIVKMRSNDENKDKIKREVPEVKVTEYLNALRELCKEVYHTAEMSYTTIGFEGVGANSSGEALSKREKSTINIRNAKIKLWINLLETFSKLLLIYDDILHTNNITTTYDDVDVSVEFPEYNGQSFAEKVEELTKAKLNGLIDTATAVERLYGDEYTIEQKAVITRNSKIENGIPLLDNQLVNDDGVIE